MGQRCATAWRCAVLLGIVPGLVLGVSSIVPGKGEAQVGTRSKLEVVRLANPAARNVSFLPTDAGTTKGLFREEGIELQRLQLKANLAVSLTVGGSVDYTSAFTSTVRAVVQGVPLKVLVCVTCKTFHAIVAQPEIGEVKDLRGKRIGITGFGSLTEVAMVAALRHVGLGRQHVIMVELRGDRLAAMAARSIDAAVMPSPESIYATRRGFREIATAAEIRQLLQESPSSGLATTVKKIDTNPDQVKRMVRGTIRSLRYVWEHREEMIQFIVEHWQYDREIATRLYDEGLGALSRDGRVSERALLATIDQAKTFLKSSQEISITQVADFSFLNEVLKEKP